jgi:hypothetical protein
MSVVSQVKLLVLDVDGTILTSEHRISPATRRAVGGLVDRGVGVAQVCAPLCPTWECPALPSHIRAP